MGLLCFCSMLQICLTVSFVHLAECFVGVVSLMFGLDEGRICL